MTKDKIYRGGSVFRLALLALLFAIPLAYAASSNNVSIMYGWNGTSFNPVTLTSTGAIMTDINMSESIGLNPKTNNTYDIGNAALLWANLYARTIRSGGFLSIIDDVNITGGLFTNSVTFADGTVQTSAATGTNVSLLYGVNTSNTAQQLPVEVDQGALKLTVRQTNTNTNMLVAGATGTDLTLERINVTGTTSNSTFAGDVRIFGTLYGGSPVKIAGLNITDGNLFVTGALVVNSTTITGASASGWTISGSNVYNNTASVGIGTSSPMSMLDVRGNVSLNNTLYTMDSATVAYGGGDSYVKLMLHMNGTNGATTFTDDSNSAKSPSAVGNAQISTAQSKFGGASALFDGSGDYVSVPDSSDFTFTGTNFTIDFWTYIQTTVSTQKSMFSQEEADYYPAHFFEIYDSKFRWVMRKSAGGNGDIFDIYSGGVTLATNTWYHVALVKNGTTYSMYIDGVLRANTTSAVALEDAATPFTIGGRPNGGAIWWDGYIDEFRVSKGIARWTANFTPPSSPYPTNSTITTNVGIGTTSPAARLDVNGTILGALPLTDVAISNYANGYETYGGIMVVVVPSSGVVNVRSTVAGVNATKLSDPTNWGSWSNFGAPNSSLRIVGISVAISNYANGYETYGGIITARMSSGAAYVRSTVAGVNATKLSDPTNWGSWTDFGNPGI